MRYEELIEKMQGIDLHRMGIYLNEKASVEDSISCWKDGDEWVILEVDDRQKEYETRGPEEEIISQLYGTIHFRLRPEWQK